MDETVRVRLLLGEDCAQKLWDSRVAVFGLGGVGGVALEALARSGVGHFVLVDHDRVDITNINRQIIALHSTLGRAKIDVWAQRIADMNPAISVETSDMFVLPDNIESFDWGGYDCVVDAVDTVSAKLAIIQAAQFLGVPVVSSMGAGNRLDPAKLRICDIYETQGDPLARVMRRELRARGVEHLTVVCSEELPSVHARPPASFMPVTAEAGLLIANEVIRLLCLANCHS